MEKLNQGTQAPLQGDQFPIVGSGNEVPVVPAVIASREIIEALLTVAQEIKLTLIDTLGLG